MSAFAVCDFSKWLQRLACGCLMAAAALPAVAQVNASLCGPIEGGGYGPFDYRVDRDKLPVVEHAHFTAEVEALVRGKSGAIGGDLNYTLRKFPNHHRALAAVMRYGEKSASPQPRDLPLPVECYFDLATRFRADDVIVRMLYAKFLFSNRREQDANRQLTEVDRLSTDDPFSHYNVGLIYFEFKNYEQALVQAHKAQQLGFNAEVLRERLKAVGKWTDRVEAPAETQTPAGEPVETKK